MSDKISLANELLSLSLEIEARLAESDLTFAKNNEPKRMELAKKIFSTEIAKEDTEEVHKIITQVLEINSRLENFAINAKSEVAKLSKNIKFAKKAQNAYQENI